MLRVAQKFARIFSAIDRHYFMFAYIKNRWLRLVIIFFIIIFVLLGTAVKIDSSENSLPAQKNVPVYITSKGYEPQEITITQGDTVTWNNVQRNVKNWPAANDYSNHAFYPEKSEEDCLSSSFDACKEIAFSETWSFTFNEPGHWGYHDHISHSQNGIIHVVPIEKKYVREITTKVLNTIENATLRIRHARSAPNKEFFQGLAYEEKRLVVETLSNISPKHTWQYLKDSETREDKTIINSISELHDLGHIVGNNLYLKYDLKGISLCDNTFEYACYHGVLEEFIPNNGGIKAVKGAALIRACGQTQSLEKAHQYSFFDCVHGVGHGLVLSAGLNLTNAFAACDIFDESIRNFCYNGVYMEYVQSAPKNYFDINEPWKPCADIDTKYHESCGRYQARVFKKIFNFDTQKQIQTCLLAPNEILKNNCIKRSVADVYAIQGDVSNDIDDIIDDIIELCELAAQSGKKESQYDCILYVAYKMSAFKYKNWENTVLTLCRTLPFEWKRKCMFSVFF